MPETDLYTPVKRFLESQGYAVKGEVHGCDVVGTRDQAVVVVELKLTINLRLLLQAVDRLALTDHVYVAVPAACSPLRTQRKRVLRLLRMLGLGLLTVSAGGQVQVIQDPGPYRGRKLSRVRRGRLLGEFEKRVGDPTKGGSRSRSGVITAHRQRALAIAAHLRENGACKASVVAMTLGDPKARDLLYRNVYGWFDGHGKGVYELSPRGIREIDRWSTEEPRSVPKER